MAKMGTMAKLKKRTIFIVAAIVIGLVLVAARLLYFQTVMADELQQKAVEQQLSDKTLTARRGSIYDKNGVGFTFGIEAGADVTDAVNAKIDQMAQDGTLGEVVFGYLDDNVFNTNEWNALWA